MTEFVICLLKCNKQNREKDGAGHLDKIGGGARQLWL